MTQRGGVCEPERGCDERANQRGVVEGGTNHSEGEQGQVSYKTEDKRAENRGGEAGWSGRRRTARARAGGVGTGAWSRSVRATRRVGLLYLSHHGLCDPFLSPYTLILSFSTQLYIS